MWCINRVCRRRNLHKMKTQISRSIEKTWRSFWKKIRTLMSRLLNKINKFLILTIKWVSKMTNIKSFWKQIRFRRQRSLSSIHNLTNWVKGFKDLWERTRRTERMRRTRWSWNSTGINSMMISRGVAPIRHSMILWRPTAIRIQSRLLNTMKNNLIRWDSQRPSGNLTLSLARPKALPIPLYAKIRGVQVNMNRLINCTKRHLIHRFNSKNT